MLLVSSASNRGICPASARSPHTESIPKEVCRLARFLLQLGVPSFPSFMLSLQVAAVDVVVCYTCRRTARLQNKVRVCLHCGPTHDFVGRSQRKMMMMNKQAQAQRRRRSVPRAETPRQHCSSQNKQLETKMEPIKSWSPMNRKSRRYFAPVLSHYRTNHSLSVLARSCTSTRSQQTQRKMAANERTNTTRNRKL